MLANYTIRMSEGFAADVRDLTARLNDAGAAPVPGVKPAQLIRMYIHEGMQRAEKKLARLGPNAGGGGGPTT